MLCLVFEAWRTESGRGCFTAFAFALQSVMFGLHPGGVDINANGIDG